MCKNIFIFVLFISGGLMAQELSKEISTRDKIPDIYKWNLELIYPDKESWENDFNKIENYYINEIKKYNGKLNNAKNIKNCLEVMEKGQRILDKLFVYAHMKSDEDQSNPIYTEMSSRIKSLSSSYSQACSFVRPELLMLSEKQLNDLKKNKDLKDYDLYFDMIIKMKPHTLNKNEEELIAAFSELTMAPYEIYNKLRVADIVFPKIIDDKGNEIQLTPANYQLILENQNRDFRERAFKGMYETYSKTKNTFASLLNTEVKKNVLIAKIRKYKSALDAALQSEFIPLEVYDNLINSVNNKLNYLHEYVKLRKNYLKLEKVRLYDMYVPLVEDFETNINYEDAKILIINGLEPLGDDYNDVLKKGFESRWIDVYETKNKNPGGYNWGTYDTQPYILMNYNGTIDSVLTLSHELGHALHSYYSYKNQPYAKAEYTIFTAEVASTVNELLMLKYLINNSKSKKERLYYLNQLVETIRGTVYTQVMYSEFEKIIHDRIEKGDALSAKSLNEIWKSLMEKYYGNDFEVCELAPLWWSRIPHFYRNFYVYKYATSLSAAFYIVKNIFDEKNSDVFKKKYLEFLKSGGSDYPMEILKKAGVDMKSPSVVNEILDEFGKLVNEMKLLLEL